MTVSLDNMQQLLLWRLAVTEEGEFLKDINTSLQPTKRKALIRDGYVAEEKRRHPKTGKNATYLTLDDKGWSWCQEHLRTELTTRSPQTMVILARLLHLLADYLESQDQTHSIGQLVLQARQAKQKRRERDNGQPADSSSTPTLNPETSGTASPSPADVGTPSLEETIRHACLELGKGRRNVRVRLADLRRMVTADRLMLDQKLLEMELQGELTLYPLDDPQEIGPADREAVLFTPAGSQRHIVYFVKQ